MEEERDIETEEEAEGPSGEAAEVAEAPAASPDEELLKLKDKYLRLYAELENYKKRVNKDKEYLAKYANESLLYELLPTLDHLRIALQHSSDENPSAIAEGVQITLRELERTLEKFGLEAIEALGRPFNPEFHHAMNQVISEEAEENTVVQEYRKGYKYGDKVLRPSLVAVSKRPDSSEEEDIQYVSENDDIEEET